MEMFVTALHVVLCVLMVLIILLQPGKGGDVGAAFGGGGGSTVFGPRGPAGLLARATTVVAVLFMVTSLLLSKGSSRSDGAMNSLDDEQRLLQQELDGDQAGAVPGVDASGGSTVPVEIPAEVEPENVDGSESAD